MPFLGFRDLTAADGHPVTPWAWEGDPETVTALTKCHKAQRGAVMIARGWQVYTPVYGLVEAGYVESSNPPAGVGGMVFDMDCRFFPEHVEKVLKKLPEDLHPQYIEITLSGNFRLVWDFGRVIPAVDSDYVRMLWKSFAALIRPTVLHSGFDDNSYDPGQRWTTGIEWLQYSDNPSVPAARLQEVLWDVAKKYRQDAKYDLPLTTIFEEIERRWPGKWSGSFELNSPGVRFWDPKADNPTGCIVKPDGFVCFTGPVGFVSWETLLGTDWVREARKDRLDDAITSMWFDGRQYWHNLGGVWTARSREDTLLALQAKGFDTRIGKGQTISEAGRILQLIQTTHVVDAAASLVNYPPGVHDLRTTRILNTSRVRAMPFADRQADESDFPFIHHFLSGLFARPEARPKEHFLAWLQRSYKALMYYRQDMGQAVFLCGPKHNGKTLLALRIVAPLLGDNYADPYDYLVGRTSFNSQLYSSYFWCLNDAESPRENEKTTVLSRIKDFVVNPAHQYHRKFADAAMISWIGRLMATLNDDPYSVGLLPEVNSNTEDKLCFFASQAYRGTWGTNQEVQDAIASELPFFARWLHDWEVPEDIVSPSRMGVKSFFDAHTLEINRRQHYVYNFRELLSAWVFTLWPDETEEQELSPTSLMSTLSEADSLKDLAREWKVAAAARALTALARDPESGVVDVDGGKRNFKIIKSKILQ